MSNLVPDMVLANNVIQRLEKENAKLKIRVKLLEAAVLDAANELEYANGLLGKPDYNMPNSITNKAVELRKIAGGSDES